MAEQKEQMLRRYVEYIERLAREKSPEIFTNGGIEYASQLMAVLFKNTEKEARVYCEGFKPTLITTSPYWEALNEFLNAKEKSLKVLVESDQYVNDEPIRLLKEKIAERNDDTIQIKIVSGDNRKKIYDSFDGAPCNFAIFDDNKFRFEYEPSGYRAFGSFNHPSNAKYLKTMFDKIFAVSGDIKLN